MEKRLRQRFKKMLESKIKQESFGNGQIVGAQLVGAQLIGGQKRLSGWNVFVRMNMKELKKKGDERPASQKMKDIAKLWKSLSSREQCMWNNKVKRASKKKGSGRFPKKKRPKMQTLKGSASMKVMIRKEVEKCLKGLLGL